MDEFAKDRRGNETRIGTPMATSRPNHTIPNHPYKTNERRAKPSEGEQWLGNQAGHRTVTNAAYHRASLAARLGRLYRLFVLFFLCFLFVLFLVLFFSRALGHPISLRRLEAMWGTLIAKGRARALVLLRDRCPCESAKRAIRKA